MASENKTEEASVVSKKDMEPENKVKDPPIPSKKDMASEDKVQDSPVLSKKDMEDVEKRLLADQTTSTSLTLLVNTINGTQIEALFRSKQSAIAYMIRIGTNFAASTYSDMIEDMKNDGEDTSKEDFYAYVREHISDNYRFINVRHLDPSEPIYMMQTYNYMVYGEPIEYLTNSVEKWKTKQPHRNRWSDKTFGDVIPGLTTCESDSWLKSCTVKVDPELPELELP